MAIEYAKVLDAQSKEYSVIGNTEKGAVDFEKTINKKVILGGLEKWIEDNSKENYEFYKVIVVVNENLLGSITKLLINTGFKDILVEKPGGLNLLEIRDVNSLAIAEKADIYIGYNRRFFASTLKVLELIKLDGGVTSFNFEFTEWGHIIKDLVKNEGVLEEWFLQNSSHVIDLAFFIGGEPIEMKSFVGGGSAWHPKGTVFSGAGITAEKALFTYNANWESAGRWWVEFLIKENRYIMKPMEKIFIQKRGSIQVDEFGINDEFDRLFKPGLYKQVEAFLEFEDKLMKIEEQVKMIPFYSQMCKSKNLISQVNLD